ncbi:Monocarboxylate transporter 4 [Liparis tanakae]|uniref:Monocarboxylate transporter 4 n=1 Tax=Liparis tanakae TaxID=230148 RepID=A0A4Z2E2K2_9TELE|nr:Monocarboxylate transporter 4 [Liparis tanakae]
MGGAVVDDGAPRVKAPDGGWGWAVLAGGFVITGFSYAFPKAISVFFKELIREFNVGYSDTAWISSILLAMLYGTGRAGQRRGMLYGTVRVLTAGCASSGPVCSVLVNRFGCRPVMMVGGLFASLGMILASFATSIIHIYLCIGVITGTEHSSCSADSLHSHNSLQFI